MHLRSIHAWCTAVFKGAVSRQSISFLFKFANYLPSIAMELKVSNEITWK